MLRFSARVSIFLNGPVFLDWTDEKKMDEDAQSWKGESRFKSSYYYEYGEAEEKEEIDDAERPLELSQGTVSDGPELASPKDMVSLFSPDIVVKVETIFPSEQVVKVNFSGNSGYSDLGKRKKSKRKMLGLW